MKGIVVTLDIDWASEEAIKETLDTLEELSITPTVFTTHRSLTIERRMDEMEVGLHPFFVNDR